MPTLDELLGHGSAIYTITALGSCGEVVAIYVGTSTNPVARWRSHLRHIEHCRRTQARFERFDSAYMYHALARTQRGQVHFEICMRGLSERDAYAYEREAIAYLRETYGERCLNRSPGSEPPSQRVPGRIAPLREHVLDEKTAALFARLQLNRKPRRKVRL